MKMKSATLWNHEAVHSPAKKSVWLIPIEPERLYMWMDTECL